MPQNLPARHAKRLTSLLEKVRVARGRLIFAIDATASREETWDTACQLQGEMFMEAGKIGGLEIQLVYYRGLDECRASHWTSDTHQLANTMSRITCVSGNTQIGKVLAHIRKEHAQQKVSAGVFVGDAMEEDAGTLYDAAAGLGVPLFVFQEGDDPVVKEVFSQISKLTNGAYSRFTPGAARELAELLRAVATFAVGGLTALADLRTDSARKLLGQLK
jgi:hypothetical protein